MSLPVTAPEHVADLLNQWYLQIEQDNLEKGSSMKKEIEGLLDGMEENQTVLLYYSLLDYRYQCRLKEKTTSDKNHTTDGLDAILSYYFYFYRGMHAYKIRAYDEAMECYLQAEKRLEFITDDIEKGEFYYNVASVYYHICREELSLQLAYKALAIFENDPHYTKRVAHCQIIIALDLVGLKEFSQAINYLNKAWETAIQEQDSNLKYIICHNFGLLYKDKGEPEKAIKWLEESIKSRLANEQTLYLLAEAACLAGFSEQAETWIEEGTRLSLNVSRRDYWHRFRILKVRYGNYHPNLFEKVLTEAITYFYQESIWQYVAENVPYLIQYFEKVGKMTEVEDYRQLASLAELKLAEDIGLVK